MDDLISRQDAIQAIEKYIVPIEELRKPVEGITAFNDGISTAISEIGHNVPSAEKTGRWIMSDDGLFMPICNQCGAHPWKGYIPSVEEATEVFKYCPNCGARMVEEGE